MADIFQTGALVAAALASSVGGASAPASAAPIQLVAEPVGDGVRLQVVGDAASAVEARYSLEVTSDAAAGKNRSTQRGTARLQPGTRVILITMTLGNVSHGNWSAKLLVEPSTREPYQQIRSSADTAG
ncbi:MAG TPA: curli-like amyloid fiber formation chaperone CsgH [Rhizorhapis sp.]